MIGTLSYRLISETIAESQDLAGDALDRLLCMRGEVVNSEINAFNQYKRRLVNTIDATYDLIAVRHFNLSRPMQNFVKTLQEHVLEHYGSEFGYTTIDEFLIDQHIEVPATFAAISNFLNFPITEIGEKSASWEDLDNINWEDLDLAWDKIGWENL